jgi:UPF0755 protein
MRKLALGLIFAVVFLIGVPVFIGMFMWTRITERYKGYEGTEVFVTIPRGARVVDIRRGLVEGGVVEGDLTMRAALLWSRKSNSLKAGEYRFDRPISALEVIDRLARGDVYTRRITFPEGLTMRDMAQLFAMHDLGSADDFLRAARDPAPIRDLDPAAPDLEGYLFPETYAVSRGMSAADLVAAMVARFRENFPEASHQRAQQAGYSVRQIVTLASLVEKETARAEERPIVAAVYRNRLKIGMGMQADPTVIYALQKAGRYDGNIHKGDLEFNSPYNTYRYRGLPPGPIAAPGRASLDAALAPADVPFLYFVSRNDGSHVFAQTLAEHNRNVQQFQVLYFQKQAQAGRGSPGRPGGSGDRRQKSGDRR